MAKTEPDAQVTAALDAMARSPLAGLPKLHIGGREPKAGWQILNIQPGPDVDHVAPIEDLSGFQDGAFAAIYGSHVLEHVSYARDLLGTLKGFYRVLAPGGLLMVSVPDLERLAYLFLAPYLSMQDKFMVMRMIFGGQIDDHDFHKVGLSAPILAQYLSQAGFVDWKRVANFGLFDDTSAMSFVGVPISLNMMARKP